MIRRNILLLVAATLIVLSGVVNGLWRDRWESAPAVGEAVARLAHVPRNIGDWHSTDLRLNPGEAEAVRIAGYCYRRYENVRNRHAVTILLVAGRAGPISVHTPDVCFEGAGYQKLGAVIPFTLDYGMEGKEAEFRTIRMHQAEGPVSEEVRIFWTWSAGGPWQAPEYPRLTFSGGRALYKLYVIRATGGQDVRPEDDPCADFMKRLLPELDVALGVES